MAVPDKDLAPADFFDSAKPPNTRPMRKVLVPCLSDEIVDVVFWQLKRALLFEYSQLPPSKQLMQVPCLSLAACHVYVVCAVLRMV